jgi:hypothetical protein
MDGDGESDGPPIGYPTVILNLARASAAPRVDPALGAQ